ncbi:MAG: hypothetical protein LBG80_06380 [Bacteroidales bacterium]|jgi:hypothetical protein|nr:hypothetical protein [Bacteroidales bacterium]
MQTKIIIRLVIGVFFIFNITAINAQVIETIGQNNNSFEIISSSEEGLTIKVTIGNYKKTPVIINGETYYSVENEIGTPIIKSGYPDLPKITKSIIIPNLSDVSASVISSEYIDLNMQVAPSKGILLRTVDPNTVPYAFDAVYNSDQFFPQVYYDIGDPYILHTKRGIVLKLYPFSYNPIQQIVRVYTSLTINILFNGLKYSKCVVSNY